LRLIANAPSRRETGLWATLRRAGRRLRRWMARAASWLASPLGQLVLAVAGEAMIACGSVSRSALSDTLDAVALASSSFAPPARRQRDGPRVVWG
jgi:hypothetical protein